ncbi:nickel-dependent lactate racemase [Candidatus Pacearchaeota archaeon]|nr:nickel-dependent lactate racemase [Candidatus Pacearchaeota archaeon]
MHIEIPYGKNSVELDINDKNVLEIITPSDVNPSSNPNLEVEKALRNPIDGPTIDELSPREKTVAIAVDDLTRVTPTHVLLPPIIQSFKKAGARKENIKIIIALGTHRKMTDQEMKEKYGSQVIEEYEVINHAFDDESGLEYVGKIADDVPVWINKEYLKADIRIATGNLIPHFNAGWAGGAKILLPGLAGEETVGRMHVHCATTTPNGLGMEDNATRQLIDTFAGKVGIHMLVNTVVTRRQEIVKVFAGNFIRAHQKGVDFAKRIYAVKISNVADITVSSSYPADLEFWQGLKGLFSADLATKVEGGIVELTPCPEGISMAHPQWSEYLQYSTKELKEMYDAGEIEDFVALGLALNVAHVREKHPIYMVSDGISSRDAEKIGFQKFKNIMEAVESAINHHGPESKINVLTHGGETYPIMK